MFNKDLIYVYIFLKKPYGYYKNLQREILLYKKEINIRAFTSENKRQNKKKKFLKETGKTTKY